MVYYPDCPFCSNRALTIVDVEIGGVRLKGIRCNSNECMKFTGFYKDDSDALNELSEKVEDLDSKVSDLEQ